MCVSVWVKHQIKNKNKTLVLLDRQGAPCIRLSCGFDDLSLAPQPNHTVVNNLNRVARVTYELCVCKTKTSKLFMGHEMKCVSVCG